MVCGGSSGWGRESRFLTAFRNDNFAERTIGRVTSGEQEMLALHDLTEVVPFPQSGGGWEFWFGYGEQIPHCVLE